MKQWYVLAYDVREPRRLQKVHYFLSKQALSLQNSVFLIHADSAGLKALLEGVRKRVKSRDDDIRVYPVTHPNSIWAAGKQAGALSELYMAAPEKQQSKSVKNLFSSLFSKLTKEKPK